MKKLLFIAGAIVFAAVLSVAAAIWYRAHLNDRVFALRNTEAEESASCKTIAIGHRPCGGPDGYVVYSAETTDDALLKKIAARYSALDRLLDRLTGAVSICVLATKPEVELVDGVCKRASAIPSRPR